jgi:hypothetical protein
VNVRGGHVHQKRYNDENFDRLKLYELLLSEMDYPFNMLYPLALQEYRKKWLKIISENNEKVKEILDIYFEILYDIIFDKDGNWVEPQKSARI